jgi:hypothetical protein
MERIDGAQHFIEFQPVIKVRLTVIKLHLAVIVIRLAAIEMRLAVVEVRLAATGFSTGYH